jgi:SAM-dependent methyltransferase
MTTLPPEHSPTPLSDLRGPLHEQRKIAESFGSDAGRYDRARPGYPVALVDRIVDASPGAGTPQILDVGCGTGISGRLFQAAGCQVLGLDPDPRMAELARNSGLDVEVAKFEDWAPGDRTFDAVIAGLALGGPGRGCAEGRRRAASRRPARGLLERVPATGGPARGLR